MNDTKTVLVVENDLNVRETLVKMLQAMGLRTLDVERVTRAAQLLTDEKVDAILLDLHMPGPHGQDLLRYLRKKQVPVPPTIVVSGYLRQGAISELLRLGVSGIIAKPFDPHRLRQELDRVLEGRDAASRCPGCGIEPREGDRFCRNCGEGLEETELQCEQCETPYTAGDRFCGECGAKLS